MFRKVLVLLMVFAFLAVPISAGIESRTILKPNKDTIDPFLIEKLSMARDDEKLEVIVQFKECVKKEDLGMLEKLRFKVLREFSVLPAVHAVGSRDSIIKLSYYERTFWIEYNEKMVPLMDMTTTVINATKVWSSKIVDTLGRENQPIDGTGVTVAVVDTGIDAGHPDLDYGEKVIINLKSDFGGSYVEAENTDTGSGHGTHVSGTIAGNGDASGGARRGVAPGAKIIGISTGEFLLTNVIGALEWVYENSRPNANPHNIRVVSNSWGADDGEYNPEDAVTQISEKLGYENNVVVVFAAGNSGSDNHDGHEITTGTYSNTPVVISVAAATREGDGIAYFSSRGEKGLNQTYPDVSAPGYHIWATEARKTLITAEKKSDPEDARDGYYMSISGTSMATPHVSGLVALLFHACPSLRISELHEDYNGTDSNWWSNEFTRIHEAEWILEATADYIQPDEFAMGDEKDNGIPDENETGVVGTHDYAQGYGLINAQKAVAVALTLNELRRENPNATVADALAKYMGIMKENYTAEETNVLVTSWRGDWSWLVDDKNEVMTNQPRQVYVHEKVEKIIIDLSYTTVNAEDYVVGDLTITIDYDGDGNADWTGDRTPSNNGVKHDEIELTGELGNQRGKLWNFNIDGSGVKVKNPDFYNLGNNEFNEAIIHYTVSLQLIFDTADDVIIEFSDLHATIAQFEFGEPTSDYQGGSISMLSYYYDLNEIKEEDVVVKEKSREDKGWLYALIALLIALAMIGLTYYIWRRKR